jgi:hypothetical protein
MLECLTGKRVENGEKDSTVISNGHKYSILSRTLAEMRVAAIDNCELER